MGEPVLLKAELPGLKHVSSGKVRDMFDLGDSLLIVTSDRLSAFDVVMANGIPFKGKVLNRLSEFWFNFLGVKHHMITCDVEKMPSEVKKHREVLRDRAMLVKKAKPFPIECVARGYIIGSGWKDYQSTGSVCGIKLPKGLQQASKLEEPIFTPATKAVTGHDENIGFEVAAETVGKETAEKLRDLTLSIYGKGADYAQTKGVISWLSLARGSHWSSSFQESKWTGSGRWGISSLRRARKPAHRWASVGACQSRRNDAPTIHGLGIIS